MTPPELRRLAARLDLEGAHDLACEARIRASEREAGGPPFDPLDGLLMVPGAGGGRHRSSVAAAMYVQSSYHGGLE